MIDRASPQDAYAIKKLIDYYAKKNYLIPRSLSDIFENIRDFIVYRNKATITGCCALHVVWSDLAEVRSLAVKQRHTKKGIGSMLIEKCLEDARALGVERVFTLTPKPDFFEKHGFRRVDRNELPMKIWRDCFHCPKYTECDEESLIIDV